MNRYKFLPPGLERRILYSKILESRKKTGTIYHKIDNILIYKSIILPENTDCSICLEKYRTRITIVELQCSHNFHRMCIDKWIKNNSSCPYCRKNISNY
mgnify:CR=1 FL=1